MKRILIITSVLILALVGYSQNTGFSAGYIHSGTIGYNFFTGKDATSFSTTPKAFGSGVYDFSGQYSPYYFWILRPEKRNIGISTSITYKLSKYRFEDNLLFDTQNNQIITDTTSGRLYNQMFFSRHGSKLVVGKISIPLLVYFPVSQWFGDTKGSFGMFAGAYYDGFLFAYHKLMYEENGQFIKNKTRSALLKNYFNKNSFGVKAGLKIFNVFVFAEHSITPMFSTLPYDVYENRIGFTYHFNFTNKLGNKLDINEDNNGTDAH